MTVRYSVTRTWEDRPWDGMMRLPLRETYEVNGLAEVTQCIQWVYVGHGVYYGNNGRCGQSDLVTFIARPLP